MVANQQMVTLSGTTTELFRKGRGPTLLLIQGAGTGKQAWYPIIDLLADTIDCVTFDNRGVGKASDISEPLTIDQLATDAAEVIDYLGQGPIHVGGVSLGGMIAMRLASQRPELVKSLTLHSTAAALDGRVRDVNEFRMAIIDSGADLSVLRTFVALWSEGSGGLDFELPGDSVAPERFDRNNYLMHMNAARTHAMNSEELSAIVCPTLITVGSDDILTTAQNAQHLHRSIPGSTLVTVEDAGHGYYISDPHMVAMLQAGWVLSHD